jgi:hypothetical protein
MSGKTISVDVQWALQGKTLDRAGYQVLACSAGELSKENFTELINRFSLGTPDKLPQVSVSYVTLTSGTRPGREHYLGMAIQKWAADVRTDGDELLERDDDGRAVAVTAYFCVPYQPPAEITVSYESIYQKFNGVWLGTTSRPPLPVELPARTSLPVPSALAMQAASRLLTGRPVCVLGAESTTVEERLAFIEAVSQMVPYGFRTRLTAATWVRATQRDHRFRLFFSAAKRDGDPPDGVVYWEQPELTALTSRDDYAYAYNQWLANTVGQLDLLARLTAPRSFTEHDILEALDEIGVQGRPSVQKRWGDKRADNRRPTPEPVPAPAPPPPAPSPKQKRSGLDIEQLLRECAECGRPPLNLPDLHIAITRLKSQGRSGKIGPEERCRYQQIIKEEHLFRRNQSIGELEPKLRDALFKVAFTTQLSYEDYCLIEDSCLTEDSSGALYPDWDLLRMIMDTGMSDLRIKAVVYAPLPLEETRKNLDRWYKSGQVHAVELINTAASPWHRPSHAFLASVIVVDYLNRMHCEPDLMRKVLHGHSYLAYLLQTVGEGHDNSQVAMLSTFLKAAYPDALTERDIRQILTGNEHPPSPALLIAVLLRIHPKNTLLAQQAREAYVFSTTMTMRLNGDIHQALSLRLYFADEWPGDRRGPGMTGTAS